MMTQSVKTQATNLPGSSKGSVTSKSWQTKSGFDAFLSNNLKTGKETAGITDASNVMKNAVQAKNSIQDKKDLTDNSVHKDTSAESADTKKTEKPDNTKAADEADNLKKTVKTTAGKNIGKTAAKKADTAVAGTGKKDSKEEKEELSPEEQLSAKIHDMLAQVQDAVMQILQITPEEFNQLMTQFQSINGEINPADLFQPDTLKQLVLLNSGQTDVLSALTDENLANTMKQLLEAVNQIKADADLPLSDDQIKSILDQVQTNGTASNDGQKTLDGTDASVQNADEDTPLQKAAGKSEQVTIVNKGQIKTEPGQLKEAATEVPKLSQLSESSTQTQADTGKSDDRSFDTSDQFQAFVDKLVQATQTTQADSSGNLVQVTELREIANQIIDKIKVLVNPEQTSMELQLNPEELGKVNLTIQQKDGVMTAQFVVQNELSKEAIESQMNTLRESLNQQGIKVDTMEVTVSAYAFNQNSQADHGSQSEEQKNNSGRKISLEDAFTMSELPVEENSVTDSDGLRGSQIDYTA